QNKKNNFDIAERAEDILKELEQQELELNETFEQLSKDEFMAEKYKKNKHKLVEENVNQYFKITKFRLFEEQLNSGVKDVCRATYNGVPFDGGMNNANQINVGLDIINTLNKHFVIRVSVFLDNAESVIDRKSIRLNS